MDPKEHRTEELTDEVLADEITLLGELMASAAAAGRPLTQAEVDQALGLADRADDVRERLDEHAVVERATGYIAETRGLDMSQARSVLRAAAAEAGVAEVDAAREVLKGPSLASREPRE
ncbi:ANTAR domain-containing protein [Pedococcus sp. 5OH_020]|uniref:ANTAR domain-containing protein n=1 Tax=Pedococcus sp. 5OH_020 TaxID=2989814 RepID=UPI0022E9D81F|nr:ANTAR domain-containing protein [Pedococcus sp. 5OH_020]